MKTCEDCNHPDHYNACHWCQCIKTYLCQECDQFLTLDQEPEHMELVHGRKIDEKVEPIERGRGEAQKWIEEGMEAYYQKYK